MKESIDLTERRDFRDSGEKSPVRYPHRLLPWVQAGDFELAEKRSSGRITLSNASTWTTMTDRIEWNSFDINNDDDNFSSFSTSITDSSTRIFHSLNNTSAWMDYSGLYIEYGADGFISYNMHDKEKLVDFPLGHRDYIISHRKPIENKPRFVTKQKFCNMCKSKIPRTPWSYTTSFSRALCIDCKEKDEREFEKTWRDKTIKINKPLFKQKGGYVPCLSRNIPMEKLEKRIPKRYIEWHEMYMPKYIYDVFDRTDSGIRSKAVFYKGKELRRREEPWQPKGRIPQEYDSWFNNTDWHDMLKKRIGTLERDSILQKEDTRTFRLNIGFNNDIFITA